jgi:hypothetical protein
MNSLVVRCTFCGKLHLLDIEDLDCWFSECGCGACGFAQDDSEFGEGLNKGVGFTVHEVPNPRGTFVHLADPLPVFVNEKGCWVYVCWYKKDDRPYV